MTDTDELLPCPFCGGGAMVCHKPFVGANGMGVVVECNLCWASTGYYKTREQAIEAWNRRAEDD